MKSGTLSKELKTAYSGMTWAHGANGGMSRDKLAWVQGVEGREFLAKQTGTQAKWQRLINRKWVWCISARGTLTRFKWRKSKKWGEKGWGFKEVAESKGKKTKIKEKENNVSKQGRDAFRVAVKDFISLAQRLPGGLQMSQNLVIKD